MRFVTFQTEEGVNNELQKLIEDSFRLPGDSRRENAIVAILRNESKASVLEVISDLVVRRSPIAIVVATRVVNDRDVARKVFDLAVNASNASSIQYTLRFGISKMGAKAMIKALKEKKVLHPQLVDHALYWLPNLLPEQDVSLLRELY